jgi:hypothetical protein
MAKLERKRERGLPAIARAREDRARGRTRWTTQAGLLAGAVVIGGLVAHKFVSQRELNEDRQALVAKQRAVAVTLGPQWFPLRDKLEADVLGAAHEDDTRDQIDPQARTGQFRTQPGLYLRLRLADAKDAASVRAIAADAKKDAFASCLLREANERGARGEIDGGAFAEQPWNLGQAYASTRILTDEWMQEVKDADDDLRLRVFAEQYNKAVKSEIPLAIDILRRATFFLLVLDEDVPEAAKITDGGRATPTPSEETLQLVPHPARVFLFDLASGHEILRVRRTGDARVIPAGERLVSDPEMRDAMQRQANNCSLASHVQEVLVAQAM